jgi:ribosomal protein L21E
LVENEARRRSYARARAMIKRDQEENEEPLRPYVRNVQTFRPGDFVRVKADNAQASVLLGRPRKWTQQWSGKGKILGPIEGYPDQYMVENTATGRIVRCSAATMIKAMDEQADDATAKSLHYERPECR